MALEQANLELVTNGSFVRGIYNLYDDALGSMGLFALLLAVITLSMIYIKTQSWPAVSITAIVMIGIIYSEISLSLHPLFYLLTLVGIFVAIYGFFWKSGY